MMHEKRKYSIKKYDNLDELVEKLTQYDWCGCNGFELNDLILLNDATGADGAQEYGVIKNGRQIESLTVSWMKPEDLKQCLVELTQDGAGVDMGEYQIKFHEDGPCYLCA